MKTGIKIINLEGSDILKNNLEDRVIKKEYKGVLVDSLLLDKLKDKSVGLKVSKSETTRDVVMVNFKYPYTPKGVEGLQQQIQENKKHIKQNIEDKKIQLEMRKQQSNNKEKQPYTNEINHLIEVNKNLKEENKRLELEIKKMELSNELIRKKLYKEGFHLDFFKQDRTTKEYKIAETIEYVFFYRSPSKSKTGSVCFVNKKLHKQINEWQTMGIHLPPKQAKKVEMEAYKSLTSSGIENKIIVNPTTEILVVNDLDSYMECMCAKVQYRIADKEKDAEKENMCFVKNEISKIKNTIWDGMALLDDSLFTDYKQSGMMVLRQHFFKACAFRTYIQKFYIDYCIKNNIDYNTFTVKDRYGRDVLVKNIKMITTENAMKWEKFNVTYDYWASKVNADNNIFGVVKTDHKSKYGDYQRMSFQMINTLPIIAEECKKLCDESIAYLQSLKVQNKAFIQFLEITKNEFNANEMFIDLYKHNKEFKKSELFRKFRVETISKLKENLRAGKLLANADNLTVCGNPYALLLHSVGDLNKYIHNNIIEGFEDVTLPILDNESKVVSCYTTRFNDEYLTAFRSPHNAPNNILYFKNTKNELMDKYFNFSDNIIAVNLIKTNSQDRANGFDEDSDFFYVSNNSILLEAGKKAQDYHTIVNCIEKDNKKYDNTMEDMALIDNTLAKSKYDIGLSSNLAQLAMSFYWKDTSNTELKDIVCILSVLAQVAIDSSKRRFVVDVSKEIERINKLECMQVKTKDNLNAKPYFWQYIKEFKEKQVDKINYDPTITLTEEEIKGMTVDEVKEYKLQLKQELIEQDKQRYIAEKKKATNIKEDKINQRRKHCLQEKICPMDYIQIAIDQIEVNKDNSKYIKDINFIRSIEGKANKRKMDKITKLVKSLDDMYKAHFDNSNKGIEIDDEEWIIEQQINTEKTFTDLSKIKMSEKDIKTMQMIISNTLKGRQNKKYKRRILNCLYKNHKDLFMKVWK
ncbi:hypothetical protein G8S55_11595 [Clostridium botulinum C]|uniref:hypothetical protein n=1 Tax=Clostridium botulinum TaxID=1491 RepID=UPI001E468E94|nr:hypothetical protein [Clostridium botulinum]MCD3217861.1 hypothetical protein [Clostridium botulinum C]